MLSACPPRRGADSKNRLSPRKKGLAKSHVPVHVLGRESTPHRAE